MLIGPRVSDPDSLIPDPDPAFYAEYRSGSGSNPDPGFWWPKFKKFTAKKNLIFFWSKNATYLFQASIMDVQASGEAFSPQKRTSSTSKHEISSLFPFFEVIFALLEPLTWLNPDPDPKHWLNHLVL
jgi:hypothetical protein